MTRLDQPKRWKLILPGILLVALVFAAYFPALRGGFLWDDDSNIVKSAPLRSYIGLVQIWLQPGATQQYYPLTHTTFWFDYHLWRFNTVGYHVENILLHATSSILLWLLLLRLGVKGAWLAAALFALHPVNAESVAWMTERKNCLSGVFFMASLLAAVEFWQLTKPAGDAHSSFKFYFLALALFVCALFSKTATIGLPIVVALLIWWKRGSILRRDLALLLPFLVIGAALALVTMSLEKHHLGATGPEWNFTLAERFVIAGRAFWFYLGKLFWPHPLMFMYPLWTLNASHILAYVPLVAAIAGLSLLWFLPKAWSRPAFLAIAYFIVMLFPVLGFFNVVFYHYSFVCDHFQYLACIGPLTLFAAGITLLLNRANPDTPLLHCAAPAVLLPVLCILTWRQAGIYRDPQTLWRDTLAHNPGSWMAHDNLGTYYSYKKQFPQASLEYLKALEIRPQDYMAWNDLGMDAAQRGKLDDAVQYFVQALQFLPDYALGHYNLGNVLARQEKYVDAIQHFNASLKLDPNFAPAHYSLAAALAHTGDPDGAIKQYKLTLQLDPDFAPAHASLGRILAAKRDIPEAIIHYRAALALDPTSVDAMANLANALVMEKDYDEAIAYYRTALKINPNSAVLHYDLGVALDRAGNIEESQKELTTAARLKSLTAPGH
jgi:tetratricopeptide (TPR) repeat protein